MVRILRVEKNGSTPYKFLWGRNYRRITYILAYPTSIAKNSMHPYHVFFVLPFNNHRGPWDFWGEKTWPEKGRHPENQVQSLDPQGPGRVEGDGCNVASENGSGRSIRKNYGWCTPQKSNIDTKNGHFLRDLPFPNHHFGCQMLSKGCHPSPSLRVYGRHPDWFWCLFINPTIGLMKITLFWEVHSGKLTARWLEDGPGWKIYFLLKMGIFHSYCLLYQGVTKKTLAIYLTWWMMYGRSQGAPL